jgi:GNAT superfamily N-acetyltransferase
MNIYFRPSEMIYVSNLRLQYLSELPEAQEYYVEQLIKKSAVQNILDDNNGIGYFIIAPDNILLEYYLVNAGNAVYEDVFSQILSSFNIEKVLCKSFDGKLLEACRKHCRSFRVQGLLFRNCRDTEITNELFNVRNAVEDDLECIVEMSEGIFEGRDEINHYIFSDQIKVFEKDEIVSGIGIVTKIFPDKPYYDIGVAVRKDERGKGIGSLIINYLFRYLKGLGYYPQAACGLDNIASQKALEIAGFITTHELLEFTTNLKQ